MTDDKNRHDEDLLCMAFNAHCDIYFPVTRGKLVWTHIANQGRSAGQGDKLKKMGVNAGWFDYIFVQFPSKFSCVSLEAKVHDNKGKKRDYSHSQKTWDYLTEGMPIFKAKFYSVKEGHNLLIEAGINPLMPCTIFKEPNYLTKKEKIQHAISWNMP